MYNIIYSQVLLSINAWLQLTEEYFIHLLSSLIGIVP
jgi:hypothetical protein